MNGALLALLAIAILLIGYFTYGGYVARKLGIDPVRPTPAHTKRDGRDYVPTPSSVLLGHHFASIAGAAPIAGPIAAAVFGWLPAVLWVLIGGIFAGAVHDLSSLVASVRHGGKSIGEVIGDNIGPGGRPLFLVFAWLALVLLIAAFISILASTFAAIPQAATASVLFIPLAIGFGTVVRYTNCGINACHVAGLLLLSACVWLGYQWPLSIEDGSWYWILLVYMLAASAMPVWVLLQPRDYLNTLLLYTSLGGALVGILAVGPVFHLPAYTGFYAVEIGYLFPMLFVTIACGAISGFHSLIASGTTSKLLKTEAHAKRIGYGAMLIESFVAVTAIIAVAVLTQQRYGELMSTAGVFTIYAQGLAGFLAAVGIPEPVGVTFFSLTASAFALTALDTACRLGRYTLHELAACEGFRRVPGLRNRYAATGITLGVAGLLLFSGHFAALWPIFGAANQLLAALALLAVSVWLANQKRDNKFVLYPMIFMVAVTLSALVLMFRQQVVQGGWQLSVLCALLILLAIVLVVMARGALVSAKQTPTARVAGGD